MIKLVAPGMEKIIGRVIQNNIHILSLLKESQEMKQRAQEIKKATQSQDNNDNAQRLLATNIFDQVRQWHIRILSFRDESHDFSKETEELNEEIQSLIDTVQSAASDGYRDALDTTSSLPESPAEAQGNETVGPSNAKINSTSDSGSSLDLFQEPAKTVHPEGNETVENPDGETNNALESVSSLDLFRESSTPANVPGEDNSIPADASREKNVSQGGEINADREGASSSPRSTNGNVPVETESGGISNDSGSGLTLNPNGVGEMAATADADDTSLAAEGVRSSASTDVTEEDPFVEPGVPTNTNGDSSLDPAAAQESVDEQETIPATANTGEAVYEEEVLPAPGSAEESRDEKEVRRRYGLFPAHDWNKYIGNSNPHID